MPFGRQLKCYVCNVEGRAQQMPRIGEDEDKQQIALSRRSANNLPNMNIENDIRLCFNCNQSIQNEIAAIQADPTCLRLNVLIQRGSHAYIICNAVNDVHRISTECRVHVFAQNNIYVPENVRSSRPRLEDADMLTDEEFKCLFPVSKQQFEDILTFCSIRHVSRKDVMIFLCKIRQGLADEFLKIIFNYSSRYILNRYYPLIHMQEATVEVAREILQRAQTANVVQARVEVNNLRNRHAQWQRLNNQVPDFPQLNVDYLRDITVYLSG
ncbi:hypothetical protein ALC57_18444 [Trachymyrmex cornetzi]|uniref:Uncharacterized protein n=1 Tax=Trachymyrmex cornetzi TaxID=471704 RepID=A0A151IRS7_9HYME|nr:hypothetical protein ALC57_18444 [Trachymyrmex cornetzi]